MEKHQNIITIDGPAGSGKSTIAHLLAKKLNWVHVNTGAIYRTFAFLMSRLGSNVDPSDATNIETIADQIGAQYRQDDTVHEVFLDSENITEQIHTPAISNLSSMYAQNPLVRQKLLPIQRKIVEEYPGVIVDGRDMGTIVFPDAPLKIFLTANAETRARRRFNELKARNLNVDYETILREMQERDRRDTTRNIAPCVPAADAVILDSSNYSADEIVNQILALKV